MWVAIAAVAFTSVARAETSLQSAKAFTHPVLEFLARSQTQNPAVHSTVARSAHPGSRRQADSIFRSVGPGTWMAMLPVFFIGLISPLTPHSVSSRPSPGRAPAAPLLSALFQRPPPCLA
jgi:hypothetical protein